MTTSLQVAWQRRIFIPDEILLLIFDYATQRQLPAVLKIARVCQGWRRLALEAPYLWRDVRCLRPQHSHAHDSTNDKVLYIIRLCDERSKGTLTHVNLANIKTRHCLEQGLHILARSKDSLYDLEISEESLCRCKDCFPPQGAASQSATSDAERTTASYASAAASILKAVGQARNLHRLCISLSLARGVDLQAMGGNPLARPKDVVFHTRLVAPPFAWATEIFSFFDELTSEMEHFTEHGEPGSYDARDCIFPTQSWIWSTLRRRAHALRTCDVPLCGTPPALPTMHFPKLQEAKLRPFPEYRSEDSDTGLAYRMPALKKLCTWPSRSFDEQYPQVKVAHLIVTTTGACRILPETLKRLPHLESLTLQVSSEPWLPIGNLNGLLEEALKVLVPSRSGAIHLPNLRHLGLMQLLQDAWDDDYAAFDWATTPWSEDCIDRFNRGIEMGDWDLPDIIIQIERERRQLSQGHEDALQSNKARGGQDLSSDPVRERPALRGPCGPCSPLETIKIGGLNVDAGTWMAICQSTEAKITCLPNPLDIEEGSEAPATSEPLRLALEEAQAILKKYAAS